MHLLQPALLPDTLVALTWLATALGLALALRLAPWRRVLAVPVRQHLLLGTCAFYCVIATLHADIGGVVIIHPLVIAAAVLLLGPALTVIAALSALLVLDILHVGRFAAFGIDGLCGVLLPTLVSVGMLRLSRRVTAAPFFAFLFIGGFFGGGATVVAAAGATTALLALGGQPEMAQTAWHNAALLPLLMFAEGFINGTIITALATFQPDWVRMLREPE